MGNDWWVAMGKGVVILAGKGVTSTTAVSLSSSTVPPSIRRFVLLSLALDPPLRSVENTERESVQTCV